MGNLLVFLREDKKLHRLALIIHYIVEHQALDNHCTQTEYHHPTSGINGKKVGYTENGVMASGFDLRPYIIKGENVIAVPSVIAVE